MLLTEYLSFAKFTQVGAIGGPVRERKVDNTQRVSDPICNKCNQPCNVRIVEEPTYDNGITVFYQEVGVSWCCGADYSKAGVAA